MESSSIFLSAGDPSGDNAASRLVSHLKDLVPDCEVSGLGGNRLHQLDQRQLANPEELAVLGFWEVAKRFLFFRGLMKRCVDEIKRQHPSAVVLVDYPGFNLRLARRIQSLGIPIVYYISPQIWAWGKRRIKDIRELVNVMLLILPFEEDFYAGTGVKTEFVGHYLLEDIPPDYISSDIPTDKPPTLAVLPGSRSQEIERMLPSMLEAARLFNRKYGFKAVVAGIKGRFDYSRYLESYSADDISITYDDARKTVLESSFVLTASGTATLEAAIIGRPMVVVYKTGFLTYQIARSLVRLDSIALVNLVLGEKVVPELIQRQASPENMFRSLAKFADDGQYRQSVVDKLKAVPELLGGSGASRRAAEVIAGFVGGK